MSKRTGAVFVGGSHDGTVHHHFNWLSTVEVSAPDPASNWPLAPIPNNVVIREHYLNVERYTLRIITSANEEIRFYAIDNISDSVAITRMVKAYGERTQ